MECLLVRCWDTRPDLYLLCLSGRPSLGDRMSITMMQLVEECANMESPVQDEKQLLLETLKASWATLPRVSPP